MGNLYTHIVKRNDGRIAKLQELRIAFQSKPRDWKYISKLRTELHIIEQKQKRKQYTGVRKITGIFN